MKLVVAITGASGVSLGLKFVEKLPKSIEKFLIFSDSAKAVMQLEENITLFDDSNIGASIASGSFKSDAMAIIPCSMNTLAKISVGIADNLTTRVASVMIKEKRKLLLAPRELPLSSIALENMLKLSQIGAIIAPPILGYYANHSSLDEVEDFLIGRWFDSLGIENSLYKRWE